MKKQNHRNKNNTLSRSAGFSLVELLVVIAIMAILVGGVGIGVSVLSSGDAKKAAKNIDVILADVRNNTLSIQGKWEAKIVSEDGASRIEVIKDGTVTSSTKLGSRVNIYYKDMERNKLKLGDGGFDQIIVSFMVSSGKFKTITNNSGDSLKNTSSSYGCIYITGSGSEYILKLWYDTGKITKE